MKIFVSWSGAVSHKVAIAFRDWLPKVIQSVRPYVSSEDIQKGARWSTEVEKELVDSRFGIICLTRENLNAPWIHFEAGALSKTIQNSAVAVSPFLFELRQSDVQGPLAQFQSVRNERDDVLRLVTSINNAEEVSLQLEAGLLRESFDAFWPRLNEGLTNIAREHSAHGGTAQAVRAEGEILEELLELVRTQQRTLVSKDEFSMQIAFLRNELNRINPYFHSGSGFENIPGRLGVLSSFVVGEPAVVQFGVGAKTLGTEEVREAASDDATPKAAEKK